MPESTLPQLKRSSAPFGLVQTEIQTKSFMSWRNWNCTSILTSSGCKIAENFTILGTRANNLINPGHDGIKDLAWQILDPVFEVFPIFTTSGCPSAIWSAPRPYLNAQLEQAIRHWHVSKSPQNLSHVKKSLTFKTNTPRYSLNVRTFHGSHSRFGLWRVWMYNKVNI